MNLSAMITLLSSRDPVDVYRELLETNDDFRGFIDRNKNKSTSEMIEEFGLIKIIGENKGLH